MADWNKPDLASTKSSILSEARSLATNACKLNPASDTNRPAGLIYLNRAAGRLQEYDGVSAFADVPMYTRNSMGTTGGTASAVTLGGTQVSALTSIPTNTFFWVLFNGSTQVTTGATLNINSLGAVNLKYLDYSGAKQAILTGQIKLGNYYLLVYDSTDFIVMNPAFIPPYVNTGVSAAGANQGAATALLGQALRNFYNISGGSGGVRLFSPTIVGQEAIIYNTTGSAVNVYPDTGHSIGALSSNTALSLPSHQGIVLFAYSSTAWGQISTVTA